MLQPYIEKQFEVRVTCVGTKLFACRIDSQASDQTRVDWRHYGSHHVNHVPWSLPPGLADRIIRFMSYCRLAYGAIDLIVSPTGQIVFLEVNPSGQYLWLEHLTGLPITGAIADWLGGSI